jgi:hypothetical protein
VVDAELCEVDEVEPVALGQPARQRRLRRALGRRCLRNADSSPSAPAPFTVEAVLPFMLNPTE